MISQALIFQINEELGLNFLTIDEIISTTNLNTLKSFLKIINDLTVLDGSVGDGRFLVATYKYLNAIYNEIFKKEEAKLEKYLSSLPYLNFNNMYGMEINLKSLKICHDNLRNEIPLKTKNEELKEVIEKNVIAGNFLKSNKSDWSRLPKKFRGFDIVLGNPPWGSKLGTKEKDYFFDKFQLKGSKRNLNAFELFIYQSNNLLSLKNGILGLYLPKNLARSNQYTNLRKFLLNNYEISSLNFFELFQNVTQEFISIIGRKAIKIHPQHEILINNERKLPQKLFQLNTDYIFTLGIDEPSIQKLKLINSDSFALEHYLTVKRGEELSKKGGIMFCQACNAWVPLSSRKPQIECSYCKRKIKKEEVQTQFLINKIKTPEHQTPILTGDDFDRYVITGNHFFNDSVEFRTKKKEGIYRSPKVVIQKIKRYPWAAFDKNNRKTTQNVYNLRLVDKLAHDTDLLFYIMAILNSRLMTWYYEKQFNLGSKFTNAISIRNLKRLPIKKPNTKSQLFSEIVKISKELSSPKRVASKQLPVEKLNLLIFKLYGLKKDLDMV